MNPIIVLMTDFGSHSWYVGVMKGVIARVNPSARVIDLCHDVSSEDVREGSFILGLSFPFFPRGAIFVAVVDPGVGSDRKNLVVKTDNHFFVGPDNGILTSVFERGKVERVHQVSSGKYTLAPKGCTFLGRDIFAPVAAHLSLGVPPEEMGGEVESVFMASALAPFVNERGEISGRAVYVDCFGNIITNIEESYLGSVFPGRIPRDDLTIRLAGRTIKGVRRYYAEGECGKLMAVVNSWGFIEITVNRGNAFRHLGLVEKKSLEIFISRDVQ
jgi:hypothetical protein